MTPTSASSTRAHPLKRLREIIGISQDAFAEITGISVDTIRALEIRRRAGGVLSDTQKMQIILSIGASLDEDTEDWIFIFASDFPERVIPYAKEHFQSFRAELLQEAGERSPAVYYLVLELLSLLEAIPASAFNGWFWKLNYLFDQWHKEIPWRRTLGYELQPFWDPKTARILGYRKMFPSLLQGEEKRFGELIEHARQVHANQTERFSANDDELEALEKARSKRSPKKARRSRPRSAGGSRNT